MGHLSSQHEAEEAAGESQTRQAFLHFSTEAIMSLLLTAHWSERHLSNLKHKRLGDVVFLCAQEEKGRIWLPKH